LPIEVTAKDSGEEIKEPALEKARKIAAEEMARLGWTDQHLAGRRKGNPQKIRIAKRLRSETTMTLEWVAERLKMGAPTHLAILDGLRHGKADGQK